MSCALLTGITKAVKGKGISPRAPKEVKTDTGADFKGLLSEMLEKNGIAQRFKVSINNLAVVDAAIRTLKVRNAKEMTDTQSDNWAKAVDPAAKAHHANSHGALMK